MMAYTLKLEETLQALRDLDHPAVPAFVKALEGVGAAMAEILAGLAGVEAGETLDDLFIATTFFPVHRGQPLPEALDGYDAPSEWEAAAQDENLPDAPDALGSTRVGEDFKTEAGYVLLDGEDGEEEELLVALALADPDKLGVPADDVMAAFVLRVGGLEATPTEVWITTDPASLAGRDVQEFTRVY